MKNCIQTGDSITVTAPADGTSGTGVLVGALFGIAAASAVAGAEVVIVRSGVYELPKRPDQAWDVGTKVYWDNANSRLTSVAPGNKLVGVAVEAAADPSDTGVALLDGAIR